MPKLFEHFRAAVYLQAAQEIKSNAKNRFSETNRPIPEYISYLYTPMIQQTTFSLPAKRRGCHLITREVLEHLPHPLPQTGLLNLFVQHTSCKLYKRFYDEKPRNNLLPETRCGIECLGDNTDSIQSYRLACNNTDRHLTINIFITNSAASSPTVRRL